MVNNKKKILVASLLVAVVGFFFVLSYLSNPLRTYKTQRVKLGTESFRLYVADTLEKRTRGLSGVVKLSDNEGMLFVFDKLGFWSFWMKEMKFPIDIIFINNKRVVDIKRNIRAESYPQTFTSSVSADSVIEINANQSSKVNLSVGDDVNLK